MMGRVRREKVWHRWAWALILLISFTVFGGGYWLYYQSIEAAVYSTTLSFMEQIADHDHLNIVNQMDSKREVLLTLLKRIEVTRNSQIEDVVYSLGVEARTTSFDTLYLITADDEVYSSSYLKTSPEDDGGRRSGGLYPGAGRGRPLVHGGIQPYLPQAEGEPYRRKYLCFYDVCRQ